MPNQSRYPGTRPFQEEDRHLFFGRDHDKKKLGNLIALEKLVVLFGKSGYGKSSLLNAGVVPYLRHNKHHFPIKIRFMPSDIVTEGSKKKPLEILVRQIEEVIKKDLKQKNGGSCFLAEKMDVSKQLPDDLSAILWYYIKFIQLTKEIDEATTLIFYQFEELFRYFNDSEVDEFGRSMAALLHSNPPDEVLELISKNLNSFSDEELDQLYEPLNLKVLFSVASDHLSLLNKLKRSLPEIFKYTYELKALDRHQALEALEGPTQKEEKFDSPKFSFSKDAIDQIFDYLIKVKNKEGIELDNQDIETFQLQLIGQYAEEKIIAKKRKTELKAKLKARFRKQKESHEATKFEFSLKDLGKPSNILKKFYKKVIRSLSPLKGRRAKKLIEKGLIIEGNRVPISGSAIKRDYKVYEDTLGILEDKHLLRSEFKLKDGNRTKSYEISHFNLVKPIQDAVEKRKQKRLWILVIVLGLLIAGLLARLAYLSYESRSGILEEEVEVSNGLIINAIATARALPFEGEAPLDVRFTFAEIKPIGKVSVVRYHWEFGDGTARSNDNNPDLHHIYTEPGEYTARLFVKGSDSLKHPTRTEDVTIIVKEPRPIVQVSAIPGSGAAPLEVDFKATISEDITVSRYLWEFGDPFLSSEANPTHSFEHEGEYSVRLTIWDNTNKKFTGSALITIGNETSNAPIETNSAPMAKITASRYSGMAPMVVDFDGSTSTDDENVSRYFWEFNDGGFSEVANPEHTFNAAGQYKVRLTVWDNKMKHHTETIAISVFDSIPKIRARITAEPAYGSVPLVVHFNGNSSTGNLTKESYLWEFNDGTVSTEINPVHIFTTPRNYNVRLTVRDADDENIYNEKIIKIYALDSLKLPQPKIEASHLNGIAPLEVKFMLSNASGSETTYEWDFRDDSPISTEESPLHEFMDPGVYNVLLKVTGPERRESTSKLTITVNPPSTIDTKIYASVIQGKVPLTVQFEGSDTLVNGIENTYFWVFKNGDLTSGLSNPSPTSDVSNPKHTFAIPGTYEVYLTVTDPQGSKGNDIIQITALPDKVPIAKINSPEILGDSLPLSVEFDGSGSTDEDGTIVRYDWNFGDGQTSTDSITVHTYAVAGTYDVKLRVMDAQKQTGDTIVSIRLCPSEVEESEVVSKKWMDKFINVQNKKLPSEVNNGERWQNWRIPPDSLNLVVILSDPLTGDDSNENVQIALAFFFSKYNKKFYKFKNALDHDESMAMVRSEQFNIKSLIKRAKRYSKNTDTTTNSNANGSDNSFVPHKQSILQALAELFKEENITNRTQNIYYTAFKSSDFDGSTQKDFETILECLAL